MPLAISVKHQLRPMVVPFVQRGYEESRVLPQGPDGILDLGHFRDNKLLKSTDVELGRDMVGSLVPQSDERRGQSVALVARGDYQRFCSSGV